MWASIAMWWAGLSGESKAAIIAAIVSPIVSEILGIRVRMIRWFYIGALEKLDAARVLFYEERGSSVRTRLGGPISTIPETIIPIEKLAAKAGISVWRARRATLWQERRKKHN